MRSFQVAGVITTEAVVGATDMVAVAEAMATATVAGLVELL
jgi:hypothetical protein